MAYISLCGAQLCLSRTCQVRTCAIQNFLPGFLVVTAEQDLSADARDALYIPFPGSCAGQLAATADTHMKHDRTKGAILSGLPHKAIMIPSCLSTPSSTSTWYARVCSELGLRTPLPRLSANPGALSERPSFPLVPVRCWHRPYQSSPINRVEITSPSERCLRRGRLSSKSR